MAGDRFLVQSTILLTTITTLFLGISGFYPIRTESVKQNTLI